MGLAPAIASTTRLGVTTTEQHYAALSNQSAREAISMLDVLNDAGLQISEAVPSPQKAIPPTEK